MLLSMVKRKSEQKIKRRKRAVEKNLGRSSERRFGRKAENTPGEIRGNVFKLINFNRRLLEENRSLWNLFSRKSKKATDEIDLTAL